jgi:hypothetical protein
MDCDLNLLVIQVVFFGGKFFDVKLHDFSHTYMSSEAVLLKDFEPRHTETENDSLEKENFDNLNRKILTVFATQ